MNSLFNFLLVIQGLVAATLVTLVLMQRSEGGGLGIGGGGSPGGVMSARGAADFLTRATKWSAIIFVALAIVLASLAVGATGGSDFDDTLDRSVTPADANTATVIPGDPAGEAPAAPAEDDPLADVAE
ncbi:MAG: preprotein translocase subunit SecG [Erythrobacter sp.]|nr:MAG: preprotein translocase subunit SecG [Erythrobacter sp.]